MVFYEKFKLATERKQQVSIEMDNTEIISGTAEQYIELFNGVVINQLKIRQENGVTFVPLRDVARVIFLNH